MRLLYLVFQHLVAWLGAASPQRPIEERGDPDNSTRGYRRIQGELAGLGYRIAPSKVSGKRRAAHTTGHVIDGETSLGQQIFDI